MKFDSHVIAEITTTDGLTLVTFNDGSQYNMRLPQSVLADWLESESVGSFFFKNVRGKYAGEKVRASNAALMKLR